MIPSSGRFERIQYTQELLQDMQHAALIDDLDIDQRKVGEMIDTLRIELMDLHDERYERDDDY